MTKTAKVEVRDYYCPKCKYEVECDKYYDSDGDACHRPCHTKMTIYKEQEIMSNEFEAFLISRNEVVKIKSKFGSESKEFMQANLTANNLHKKWYDMCLNRLNKQSGKKRTALYEAIIDVAKCELVEACEYSPQRIESLFNKNA